MNRYINIDKLLERMEKTDAQPITYTERYAFAFAKKLVEHFATKNAILLPDNPTNGDMIKAMFPKLEVEIEGIYVTCWIDEHKWIEFGLDWWNASYKAESEE